MPHHHAHIARRDQHRVVHSDAAAHHDPSDIAGDQRSADQSDAPVEDAKTRSNERDQSRGLRAGPRELREPTNHARHGPARGDGMPRDQDQTHLHPEAQVPPDPGGLVCPRGGDLGRRTIREPDGQSERKEGQEDGQHERIGRGGPEECTETASDGFEHDHSILAALSFRPRTPSRACGLAGLAAPIGPTSMTGLVYP